MVGPQLSIIIPTFERPEYLSLLVEQLLGQRFQDFEILILDQSEDPAILKHDPRIQHTRIPRIGPLAGINMGINMARGAIILILNDDVSLHSDGFLDAHLACYSSTNVGGVGGRIIDRVLVPNTRKTKCKVSWGGRTVENLTGERSCLLDSVGGANMSFRAAVFRQVGLFDNTGYTGTAVLGETDFAARARKFGWVLVFAPEASLTHLSAPRGGIRTDPLATEASRFRNTGYYVMRHRGTLGLLPLLPTFSGIALKRAWQWRRPEAVRVLCGALVAGIRAGGNAPALTLAWSAKALDI